MTTIVCILSSGSTPRATVREPKSWWRILVSGRVTVEWTAYAVEHIIRCGNYDPGTEWRWYRDVPGRKNTRVPRSIERMLEDARSTAAAEGSIRRRLNWLRNRDAQEA